MRALNGRDDLGQEGFTVGIGLGDHRPADDGPCRIVREEIERPSGARGPGVEAALDRGLVSGGLVVAALGQRPWSDERKGNADGDEHDGATREQLCIRLGLACHDSVPFADQSESEGREAAHALSRGLRCLRRRSQLARRSLSSTIKEHGVGS
jgi:hypothetical protein